jgi:hypothetical protein
MENSIMPQKQNDLTPWAWHSTADWIPIDGTDQDGNKCKFSVNVLIHQPGRMMTYVVAYYDSRDDKWYPQLYEDNFSFPLVPERFCYIKRPGDWEELAEGDFERHQRLHGT